MKTLFTFPVNLVFTPQQVSWCVIETEGETLEEWLNEALATLADDTGAILESYTPQGCVQASRPVGTLPPQTKNLIESLIRENWKSSL